MQVKIGASPGQQHGGAAGNPQGASSATSASSASLTTLQVTEGDAWVPAHCVERGGGAGTQASSTSWQIGRRTAGPSGRGQTPLGPLPRGGGSLSKSGTGSAGGPACGGRGGLWLRLGRPVLAPPLPQQRWQCPRPPRLTARSRRLHPPFRVSRSVLRALLGTGWQAAGHLGQLLSRCGSRRCHGRRGRPGVTAPTRPADPARPVAASVGNVLS